MRTFKTSSRRRPRFRRRWKRRQQEVRGNVRRAAQGPWFVYCLTSTASDVPYVGSTNCLARRLRQHNGEIAGGAKRTARVLLRGGVWVRELSVSGFPDARAALQFEWMLEHLRRQGAGDDRAAGATALQRGARALQRLLARPHSTCASAPFDDFGGVCVCRETPAARAFDFPLLHAIIMD